MLTLSSPGQFNQLPQSVNIIRLLDCDLEEKHNQNQIILFWLFESK